MRTELTEKDLENKLNEIIKYHFNKSHNTNTFLFGGFYCKDIIKKRNKLTLPYEETFKLINLKFDIKTIGIELTLFNRIPNIEKYDNYVGLFLQRGLRMCTFDKLKEILNCFKKCGWDFDFAINMANNHMYYDISDLDFKSLMSHRIYLTPLDKNMIIDFKEEQ